MRITCKSTQINKLKLPHERSLIAKPWTLDLTTKFSDSSRSCTTEELSLSSSSDSLQKDYGVIPDPSPLKSKLEAEAEAEAETDINIKSPVGIIITTPRSGLNSSPKRKRCKRVRFGHVQIISTHKPASEMTDDDLSRIHCRAKDYEYFRGTANFIAAEVRNQASPEQQRQPQTTMKIRSSSHRYDDVMTKTYQMCALFSTKAPVGVTYNSHPNKDASKNNRKCHHQNHHCATHLKEPYCSRLEKKNSEQRESKIDVVDRTCLTPHLFEALAHWIKLGHSRRGLEKFSVPYLVQARSLSRQAAKNAVLGTQEILNSLGDCSYEKKEKERMKKHKGETGYRGLHHVWGWWGRRRGVSIFTSEKHKSEAVHGDVKENDGCCRIALLERLGIPKDLISPSLSNVEVLRIVSEEYTSTSKLFALTMGHADAVALGLYCDDSKNT